MLNPSKAPADSLSVRSPGFDNLRCFLIYCVVLGHVLEICPDFSRREFLYRVIYSFHMPVFLFLTGYFAKFNPNRILRQFFLPYMVFQTLYIAFANRHLDMTLVRQYTTPYWILWYLLVCMYYQVLLPMYDTDDIRQQCVRVAATAVLALLIGRDKNAGYFASVSRFFTFQPWFLLGYYCRKHSDTLRTWYFKHRENWYLLCVPVICLSLLYLKLSDFPKDVLYGSYSYAAKDYTLTTRLICMAIAFGWIVFLYGLAIDPLNRILPLVTAMGRNVMSIFLLHGFVLRAIPKHYPTIWTIPHAVLWLPPLILLILGNPLIGQLFQWIFYPKKARN